jgi:hypothetical protein
MNKLLGFIPVLSLIATPLNAMAQTVNVTAGFTANPSLALEQPLPHVK